ncbi:Cyclic nucleotide-binding domain protein [compost metagenome]
MSETLITHIRKFTRLSDEEAPAVLTFFKEIEVRKKENLLQEGQICRYNYFVTEGCLRMFFVDDKGVEKTVQFGLEHWWIADYFSFQRHQPSAFCIQAVERSVLYAIDFQTQEQLLDQYPQMERYFRMVHQTAHAASQMRLKFLYGYSREALYRQFSSSFPEFVQRIPQYLLASYLGITPEYLSELRAKNIS